MTAVHEGNQYPAPPRRHVTAAKQVYAALLGVAPQTDGPYYVGFEAADQQIGLVPAVARRA